MAMELDRVEKPLRQLRKLLKDLPKNPPPEEVHKLRTHTRRIEAVANALEPAAEKETRRLLKLLKPVRKAAGSVRDMDVLTADLLQIQKNGNSESIVRLIEHLAMKRNQNAGKLLDTVADQRKPARRQLKNYGNIIESVAIGKKPVRSEVLETLDSSNGSCTAADTLIADLSRWRTLNSSNLHEFRLKVKELRYVLQVYPAANQRFIDTLGAVKEAIGEWHDWLQLAEIAHEVLNAEDDRDLLVKIESASKQKLTRALNVSNSLRRNYLDSSSRRQAKIS
jgi:CHAD domain-containing protein